MIELAREGMTMLAVTLEMGFSRDVVHRALFGTMDGYVKEGGEELHQGQRICLGESDMLLAVADVTNLLQGSAGTVLPVDDEIVELWPDILHFPGDEARTGM